MPTDLTPNVFQGKILRPPDPIKPEDLPDKVWVLAEEAIGKDGRLQEQRTIVRAAFAIGQVAKLALGIAASEAQSGRAGKYTLPGGAYDMPDYEGEHGRIPRVSGGGGTGRQTPGDPTTPIPPPSSGYVPANALDIALSVRARYPSPLYESSPSRLAFLRDLAHALGPEAGLLEKTTGNNNNGFSVDIICFKNGEIYDVVNGTSPNAAQWSYKGRVDPSRWRAP